MSLSDSLQVNKNLIEKQNLIKATIIEQNYDKNSFFTFCMNQKPENGDDLTNWSMEELQQTINNFIEQEKKKMEENSKKEQEITDNRKEAENINLNMEQIRTQKTQNNLSPYTKEIKCREMEKSILNFKEIKITVQSPKVVETTFFTSNYITYEIITIINENLSWTVRRRYSDFLWLRTTLCNHFPRFFIPPIPGKRYGARRFQADFVEKRMHFLNEFLSNLITSETFKASEPLVSFLSILDRMQFESKMRELSSYIPSQYVEDIRTLDGKLLISCDDDQNEKYYLNINNCFKLQDQLLGRLNNNLKMFYRKINSALIHLDDIQKDFDLLHLLNNRVQMKEEVTKSYEELGIFYKNWKRILYNQNEIMKSYIKDFFKYIKMEGTAYEELVQKRDEIKNKFTAENLRLQVKKDKLWASMDMTKWEITEDMEKIDRILLLRDKNYACSKMCTKETLSLENLKKQLGYANKCNIDELKRLIKKYADMYLNNLKNFAEKMYPTLNDALNVWTTIAAFTDK